MLVTVEVEGSEEMLQAPEGCLDGPALQVNVGDNIGREGIWGQICDEEFKLVVAEVNADEAEVQLVAGIVIVKEGKVFSGNKLEVAGRIIRFLFGTGEGLVEGFVEGCIGEAITGGKTIGINILAAQHKTNAQAGQVSDGIQIAIIAIGSKDDGFRILQAISHGQKSAALAVFIEVIDDEILIGIGENIIERFDGHLIVRIGARFTVDEGVEVLEIIGNAHKRTVGSKDTITIFGTERCKM